jgi:hypothetical protein
MHSLTLKLSQAPHHFPFPPKSFPTPSPLPPYAQVLALGGGWVAPIVRLDGRPVGDGQPGPVFTALDQALRHDFNNPQLTDNVPYSPPL